MVFIFLYFINFAQNLSWVSSFMILFMFSYFMKSLFFSRHWLINCKFFRWKSSNNVEVFSSTGLSCNKIRVCVGCNLTLALLKSCDNGAPSGASYHGPGPSIYKEQTRCKRSVNARWHQLKNRRWEIFAPTAAAVNVFDAEMSGWNFFLLVLLMHCSFLGRKRLMWLIQSRITMSRFSRRRNAQPSPVYFFFGHVIGGALLFLWSFIEIPISLEY